MSESKMVCLFRTSLPVSELCAVDKAGLRG